jgi:hypothetical protein
MKCGISQLGMISRKLSPKVSKTSEQAGATGEGFTEPK